MTNAPKVHAQSVRLARGPEADRAAVRSASRRRHPLDNAPCLLDGFSVHTQVAQRRSRRQFIAALVYVVALSAVVYALMSFDSVASEGSYTAWEVSR